MHVCRLTYETFPPFKKISSGLAPNYYYLSKYQVEMGIENTIIAGGYPQYPRRDNIDGINVIRLRNLKLPFTMATAPVFNYMAWREIQKLKDSVDILHVHNPQGIWVQ